MDIPGLYGLIWLRRTMSVTIYLQFIGRVLRPMEGKEYGVILDPVGNVFIHGFPDADRKWTLDGSSGESTDPKPVICPWCGTLNEADSVTCSVCGEMLDTTEEVAHNGGRKRKLPSLVGGRLVVLDETGTQDVGDRIEEMKRRAEEAREADKKEAEAKETRVMSNAEKVRLFRQGLFTPANRENFRDAVKILKGEAT